MLKIISDRDIYLIGLVKTLVKYASELECIEEENDDEYKQLKEMIKNGIELLTYGKNENEIKIIKSYFIRDVLSEQSLGAVGGETPN